MAGVGDHRVYAANVMHAKEAVFIDIGDNEADMIHMGGKHDALAVFIRAQLFNDQVAHRIHAHAVHMRGDQALDGFGHGMLVAAGTVGGKQGFERISKHDCYLLIVRRASKRRAQARIAIEYPPDRLPTRRCGYSGRARTAHR